MHAWWAVPAAVVAIAAYAAFIVWLARLHLGGRLASGLIGGAGALVVLLPLQLILSGSRFEVVDKPAGEP